MSHWIWHIILRHVILREYKEENKESYAPTQNKKGKKSQPANANIEILFKTDHVYIQIWIEYNNNNNLNNKKEKEDYVYALCACVYICLMCCGVHVIGCGVHGSVCLCLCVCDNVCVIKPVKEILFLLAGVML